MVRSKVNRGFFRSEARYLPKQAGVGCQSRCVYCAWISTFIQAFCLLFFLIYYRIASSLFFQLCWEDGLLSVKFEPQAVPDEVRRS